MLWSVGLLECGDVSHTNLLVIGGVSQPPNEPFECLVEHMCGGYMAGNNIYYSMRYVAKRLHSIYIAQTSHTQNKTHLLYLLYG